MTLTCKWVKDETGALIMNWTERDSGVPVMMPKTRELTQLTVIFAKDDGQTGAAAKVQSYSPSGAVSLCRAREEPANPVKSRCPVTMSTAHHANSVPRPLGGFDDHPHPHPHLHPAAQCARLLPRTPSQLLAGCIGAAASVTR